MSDSYFPQPEASINYFPDESQLILKANETNRFITEIAQRYSSRDGVPYNEVKQKVETDGTDSVVPTYSTVVELSDQNISDLQTRQYTAEEALKSFQTFLDNKIILGTAGTATDTVEDIIVDSYDPKVDRRAIDMAIIREEAMKVAPDEGVFGSVASFIGMLTREATIGTVEDALGWKSKRVQNLLGDMAAETNVLKKRELARQYVEDANKRGTFGKNSFIFSSEIEAALTGGEGLNENFWTLVNAVSLIPVGKVVSSAGKSGSELLSTTSKAALMTTARDSLDVVKAARPEKADKVLTESLGIEDTTVELARHAAPGANRVAKTGGIDSVYPTINPVIKHELKNEYIASLESVFSKMNASPEAVDQAATKYVNEFVKNTGANLLNFNRKYVGFDNYDLTIQMGRDDGKLFKSATSAEKFAKQFGGKVVQFADGFGVEFTRNLPMNGVGKATEASELRSFLFDMIMSPEHLSSERLNTVLKQGTSSLGAVKTEISRAYQKAVGGLSKEEGKTIDKILLDLRDGKDSFKREWYSLPEFEAKYLDITGKEASQKVKEAYAASQKLNEAAWYIEADKYLKSATNQGIFIGSFNKADNLKLRAIDYSNFPRNTEKFVLDMNKNKLIPIEEVPKDKKIYQIVEGYTHQSGDDVFYAIGNLKNSRKLYHTDVLGYQPGGSRGMANVQSMVVQESARKTVSGTSYWGRAKTVVVARTTKEATAASREINTIIKTLRDQTGLKSGKLTKSAIKNSDEITRVILNNNGFNPSIETLDDFLKFMDDAGIGLDDVKVVSPDEQVPNMGIGGLDYLQYGNPVTYRDVYKLNANPSSATRDKILMGYGNTGMKVVNPMVAIERDFARGVNYMAQRKYLQDATEGLLKGGRRFITNYDAIKDMGIYQQLKKADFDLSSDAGSAFAREQKTILARMEEKSAFAKRYERTMNKVGSKIFDKFKWDTFDHMSFDPVVALRAFAFTLKMGLFNIDQFIVQSSAAVSIIAISPKFGTQAALAYPALRIAMINPTTTKLMAKRISGMLGMTEDEFIEYIGHFRKSGRFEVDNTIAEINGSYDISSGILRKIKDNSTVFFNEGERVGRIMANHVAYKEFREKFPTLDLTNPDNFRKMDEFIAHREDVLTMNMKSASAAGWQKGLLSIPTQWMSYNARFTEALFFGRSLSKEEKARLLLAQLVFFGSAGIGIGKIFNSFVDKSNADLDPEVYTLLRNGLLDFTVSEFTGVQTAFGGRLGVGEGLVDFIHDLFVEKKFTEVLGGPSVNFATDTLSASMDALTALVLHQNVDVAMDSANRALMNISSWNKIVQAKWILQYGEMRAKKGSVLAENLPPEAAILNMLGSKLQAVDMQFTLNDVLKDDKEYIQGLASEIRGYHQKMMDALERNDLQAARSFSEQIAFIREPLTLQQQMELDRFTRPSLISFADKVVEKSFNTGHSGLANQYQKVLNQGDNE